MSCGYVWPRRSPALIRSLVFRAGLDWSLEEALAPLGPRAQAYPALDTLVAAVTKAARPGDDILVMSNGAFGGIHERLLLALADARHPDAQG